MPSLDEFSPHSTPSTHLQIYTWPNCSLQELSHLLTTALPNLVPSPSIGTRLAFRLIFPDTRQPGPARYMHKDLGSVVLGAGGPGVEGDGVSTSNMSGEADRTLQDAKFVIGDYVCCAIMPPQADGQVAAPPPPTASRAYGPGGGAGPRENGYGGGRFGGRGPPRDFGGGVPSGPWVRGDVPGGPDGPRGGGGYGRGGGGGGYRGRGGYGRGRGGY